MASAGGPKAAGATSAKPPPLSAEEKLAEGMRIAAYKFPEGAVPPALVDIGINLADEAFSKCAPE